LTQEQFFKEISDAIVNLEKEKAIELAQKAVNENMNLLEVIEKGFGDGIRRIGDLWEMLSANGFEVYDLGADVPAEHIVETAIENNADVIGVSALLTTTMFGQKKIVEILEKKGIRNKYKVIIGGAPVNQSWTEECKADGFAGSAVEAVKLVKKLLNK